MARRKCEGLNRVTLSDNESYHAYENLLKLPLPSQYESLFSYLANFQFFHFMTLANRVQTLRDSLGHLSYCL